MADIAESHRTLTPCPICHFSFYKVKIHKRLAHDGADESLCSFCGRVYGCTDRLINHIIKKHTDEGIFCWVCSAIQKDFDDLSEHLQGHREAHHYGCQCGETFALRILMKEHIRKFHSDFTCPACHVKFSSKGLLKFHYWKYHRSSSEMKYECHECGEKFHECHLWKRHLYKHTEERPVKCHICNKAFVRHCHLREHLTQVHFNVKRYPCPKCDEVFGYIVTLQAHMTDHERVRRLSCNSCGKSFRYKKLLKEHLLERRCSWCDLVLRCSTMYNEHVSSHKLVCGICDKVFKKERLLKWHRTVMHSEYSEILFFCDKCTYSSGSKINLQRHIRRNHRILNAMKERGNQIYQISVEKEQR